ncbi:hypothetical protein BGZ49_005158 [Haplosporangium sp. Z 27]|nr:hypothetical protein BGZ49_005158 [Haplosporangium sp. Z 27]
MSYVTSMLSECLGSLVSGGSYPSSIALPKGSDLVGQEFDLWIHWVWVLWDESRQHTDGKQWCRCTTKALANQSSVGVDDSSWYSRIRAALAAAQGLTSPDGGAGRRRYGCDPDCDGDLGGQKGIVGEDDIKEGGISGKGDVDGINGTGGTIADDDRAVVGISGAEHNDGGTVDDIDEAEYNIGGTMIDVGAAEDNTCGTVGDVDGALGNIGGTIGDIGGTVSDRRRDDRSRGAGRVVDSGRECSTDCYLGSSGSLSPEVVSRAGSSLCSPSLSEKNPGL